MADPIYVGQRVLIECIFRLNGVPTDPTVTKCISRSPNGTQSTLVFPAATFTRRSTGWFEASFLVDLPGAWAFRAEAAGIVDAVNEYILTIQPSSLVL